MKFQCKIQSGALVWPAWYLTRVWKMELEGEKAIKGAETQEEAEIGSREILV